MKDVKKPLSHVWKLLSFVSLESSPVIMCCSFAVHYAMKKNTTVMSFQKGIVRKPLCFFPEFDRMCRMMLGGGSGGAGQSRAGQGKYG